MTHSQTLCQGLRVAENCSSVMSWSSSTNTTMVGVATRLLVMKTQLVTSLFFISRAYYYYSKNPQQATQDSLMCSNLLISLIGNVPRLACEAGLLGLRNDKEKKNKDEKGTGDYYSIIFFVWDVFNNYSYLKRNINTLTPSILGRFIKVIDSPKVN